MTRGQFLDACRQYGLSYYWTAIADTFARFESNYDEQALRVEPVWAGQTVQGRTSYGLFQVLGMWSPFSSARESGVRFGVQEQLEEWWKYMQDPYITGSAVDMRTMFRRYNGSGLNAEEYADRAISYMEENWPHFMQPSVGSPDQQREQFSETTNGLSLPSQSAPPSSGGLLALGAALAVVTANS